MISLPTDTTQLLSLPDQHGALLADYDFYPHLDLLHVRWHGHLTADSLVRGAKAGMRLFEGRSLPQRVLSDHSLVSGEWSEALPWLHYEWLPAAIQKGLRTVAHVLSRDPASRLTSYPGNPEFMAALQQQLRARPFRHVGPAWQWLTHH
ncbi:hypothetical protein E4631_16705 [Hymenobacter sp. UV11]|uniref:hypothetical protein n=1 Tax=Hymenobacter sp. UV11 TaxID=1849735 RepID=UPI00105BD013|nr:hypothetical protein [Hymenobacter sp. UV11]TFZ65176.1 hypothetical protein E4631_16705 [Hymenobacter sp. UV11]